MLIALLGLSAQPAGKDNEQSQDKLRVYTFEITENIAPPAWRLTQRAFEEAESL